MIATLYPLKNGLPELLRWIENNLFFTIYDVSFQLMR